MVSLFGLKLGGDKKKKPEKSEAPPSRRGRAFSRSAKDAPALEEDIPAVPRGIFSSSRPGSSQSQKLFSRKSKFFPYGSAGDGALSMANLPRPAAPDDSPLPSPAFLRPTTSNPNLNYWKSGSTTDLAVPKRPKVPPPPLDVLSAPFSSPGSAPLSASTTSVTSPRSPLGAYELTLNLPSEGLSLFGDNNEMLKPPEPLRIKKQSPTVSTFAEAELQAIKPPSPPVSIQAPTTNDTSVPKQSIESGRGQPSLERSLGRLGSNQSHYSRQELESVESPIDPAASNRFALPTPPMSVARDSEDRPSTGSSNQWGEPVIQNVRGKRDTMIVKPTRRMSFEKYVEDFSRGMLPLADNDAPPAIPAMSSKRAERPVPLKLNVRNDLVVQPALRSAPLGLSQRPLLTPSDNNRRPVPAPPLSAGVSYSRPAQQHYTSKVSKHSTDDYGCFYEEGSDDLDEERPPTPDSPLLPLSGPLASPLVRSGFQEVAEDPLERMRNFRFPAIKPDDKAPTPRYRSVSPTRESFQTAEWPLPSPVHQPKEASQLPFLLPGIAPETQVRSFSRPWTPRKDTEPLSLHDSPESLTSSVAQPHIASAMSTQMRSPVVTNFESKGGFF